MLTIKTLKEQFYSKSYLSPFRFFNEKALSLLTTEMMVFHAGCGADSTIGFRSLARLTIGMDYDLWIKENKDIDYGLIGDLTWLPLPSDSVDLIVSRWVMEHLEHPMSFLRETERILKPGGKLIVMAPNLWNYATLITRLSPHWFQRWFIKKILKGEPEEVFKTYYRANTPKKLRDQARRAGLNEEAFWLREGAPNLLGFSPITYLIGVAYERIVMKFSLFAQFRGAMIAVFFKNRQ